MNLKEALIEKKLKNGYYSAEDIALVRVTDHLPIDGKIYSLSNVPFIHRMNNLAYETIYEILEDRGLAYEERIKIAKEYTPLSSQYRSTIHFCLNGIVSSHMQGNFEDNPYIIIEPFIHHETDENLLSVRGEDTYFKDSITLSNETVILVDENHKDKVQKSKIDEKFKVVYYKGNPKEVLESELLKMGIIPELIGKDYIIESKTKELIEDYITRQNFKREKHCFSESYQEDDKKTLTLWEMYYRDFYTILCGQVTNLENKDSIIEYLSQAASFSVQAKEILKDLINLIGLETYGKIVKDYNNTLIKKLNSGNYPTNNQILNGFSIKVDTPKSI